MGVGWGVMGPLRDLTTKALAPQKFNDQTPMGTSIFEAFRSISEGSFQTEVSISFS